MRHGGRIIIRCSHTKGAGRDSFRRKGEPPQWVPFSWKQLERPPEINVLWIFPTAYKGLITLAGGRPGMEKQYDQK
uniref:Integrase n=1 Tax=Steinernema glaseri TaxID=37863 RepID=A0A1I8AVC9_9BILA